MQRLITTQLFLVFHLTFRRSNRSPLIVKKALINEKTARIFKAWFKYLELDCGKYSNVKKAKALVVEKV